MDAVEAYDRYESGSRYPNPSHVNPPNGFPLQPLRVDPKYPLPTPEKSSYNPDRTSLGDGDEYSPNSTVGRTASRRRRVSGQGNGAHPVSSPRNPQLFAAEGSPRGLLSQPQDSNEDPNKQNFSPTNPSSKSFAARARMATDRSELISAPYEANGDKAQARRQRRSSTSQPASRSPQVLTQTASTAQRVDQKSPRVLPDTMASHEYRESSQTNPGPRAPVSDIPAQPTITKTASTRTRQRDLDEPKPKWATDRSPLQKLEVKLNDISKEEKRARVQEAEQRLRDSMAGQLDRRRSPGAQAAANRTPSTRVPYNVAEKSHKNVGASERARKSPTEMSKGTHNGLERQGGPVSSEQDVNISTDTIQKRRRTSEPVVQPALVSNQPSRAVSMGQDKRGNRVADQPATYKHNPTSSPRSADRNVQRQRGERVEVEETNGINVAHTNMPGAPNERVIATIDGEQRRSRKYDSRPSGKEDVKSGKSKEVPTQQQQLYAHRAEASNGHKLDSMQEQPDDPVPGHKVHSHVHALKYEVPPQTASGIKARRRIGFGSRVAEVSENLQPHKHRLSRLLHHGHHAEEPAVPYGGPPRHLDEWRKGSVARLTLADFISNAEAARKDTAWWERNGRGVGDRMPDSQSGLYDGTMNDSNGKVHFSIPTITRSRTAIGGSREDFGVVRARQYIGYEGTLHGRRRNRSWRHKPGSLIDLQAALKIPPPQSLPRTVSDFTTTDLHHEHIRKPYLSKTLTRSMRSIRVRIPAAPTSFNPHLYLRCGPLLRYTGIKRDKVERIGRRPAMEERETWRGSVMIVTEDSRSSYEPAPTLRLFHQPMELLPLPQNLDGQDDENLPAEYVDPIGGLPKLTRTGGVVYVKPAEDLDPLTDVSLIENDDGLYEVTRTAYVPTGYGKANELLGRSPPPFARKRRDPKTVGAYKEVRGVRLHAERGVTFWRFNLEVELGEAQARIGYRINKSASTGFWVPARGQTMNIMFHSCNGFSLSIK